MARLAEAFRPQVSRPSSTRLMLTFLNITLVLFLWQMNMFVTASQTLTSIGQSSLQLDKCRSLKLKGQDIAFHIFFACECKIRKCIAERMYPKLANDA